MSDWLRMCLVGIILSRGWIDAGHGFQDPHDHIRHLVPMALLRTYLGFSLVQLLGYLIIVLDHYAPSAAIPLFYLWQFLFGIGRSTLAFSYLILVRTFNEPSDTFVVLLWLAFGRGGNNWGIFLQTLMEDALKWPWHIALTPFSLIYVLTAIIAFVAVPE